MLEKSRVYTHFRKIPENLDLSQIFRNISIFVKIFLKNLILPKRKTLILVIVYENKY